MDIDIVISQIDILKRLLKLPGTDVLWSSYNSVEEVIDELEGIENGIFNHERKSIERLLFLLAPTGALQEISISSGWGYEFLDIAERIEKAVKKK